MAVAVAVATAFILKNIKSDNARLATSEGAESKAPASFEAAAKLPKLLDLGANKCIPCKAMTPILDGLKKEYAGKMNVEFIDVWQNEDAGKQYGVEMIPTQIFLDASGKELFRHTGFFGKEDILAKWKELGVDLGDKFSKACKLGE
ncbi:MAG: thioredoxin family protein [Verrucomicrobiota bacterium]